MQNRGKLTVVTVLTFVRFPLVLIFFAGAMVYTRPTSRLPWLFTLTLGALIGSALTDFFDGYLARRFGVETTLGAHADPLMDKFFYLASLPLLVYVAGIKPDNLGHAALLLILTISMLARDQWVTFLRSLGSACNVGGKALRSGKIRTAFNFPLICAIYYFEEAPPHWQFLSAGLVVALECLGLLINLITLVTYTRHYWPALHRSASISRREEP